VLESTLPIFPLSSVVLFPDVLVPLHIFEPRYRQLTSAALEGARTIGMVAVRPDHADELDGDPPVFEIGCAGFITQHQELADGRFHIVLRGTHRFRITREVPLSEGRLYRLAETEPLTDEPGDEAGGQQLRERVIDQLVRVAETEGGERAIPLDAERLAEMEPGAFANNICQAIGLPAVEKQGLLEAGGTLERLERLSSLLAFHLAALEGRAGGGSETLQ